MLLFVLIEEKNSSGAMQTAVFFTCMITLIAILSAAWSSETCGYVRGPLAATNDTVVIKLDCNHSTLSSHSVPLQILGDVTHLAVQLARCHKVPVGLFTNVSVNLTSVTIASEDAEELLNGSFEGLGHITELRLLGFTRSTKVSRFLLEPLRSIDTLIVDGFGNDNVDLPYLGSIIQKLAGTPTRRLVINGITDRLFGYSVMHVDNFRIFNASVKELIITEVPLTYRGSIRRAFPELTCFCGAGLFDQQKAETFPAIFDLFFLSDNLKEIVLYRPKVVPALKPSNNFNSPFEQLVLSIFRKLTLYPDLGDYILARSLSDNCAAGRVLKIGVNISKLTFKNIQVPTKTDKAVCIEENNSLMYLDFTGSHFPGTIPELTGLRKLHYLSLENTSIRIFSNTFLGHYPALKVLKLNKLDIGDFLKNSNQDFFGSCPTITDIHLDNCKIGNISATIFSRLVNLQRLDMSNNYLRSLYFDLQNCIKLDILNLSHNRVESIIPERIDHLNQLALQKPEDNNLVVDLTGNVLHCLCNSTHFVKWLQRSPTVSNIKFPGFDNYTCLYPNGSIVSVSAITVDILEQRCSVIQTLVNKSGCPCDQKARTQLEQVRMSLDRLFCRNDAGDLVSMKMHPLPSCFDPYSRASFIVPVAIGGILAIAMLSTVGLLIYYRNSRRVRQVRECLEMYPVHFVHTALQYVMMHNREEERVVFQYDMIVFTQDNDQSSIHTQFLAALYGRRSVITRDNFLPGTIELEAIVESIHSCQWVVPVQTANFLSDHVCVDFISRVQFSRPHALIPVVWEQPLVVTDVAVEDLLRTGDPLYWPGDQAAPENKRIFWWSLIERTTSL